MSRTTLLVLFSLTGLSLCACAAPASSDYSLPQATTLATTPMSRPVSARLPPIAPNLDTPPNPLASPLPAAPPEIIGPSMP